MYTDQHINEPFSVKSGINASAKSIIPCQPVQTAQADMGLKFLQFGNFLHIKTQTMFSVTLKANYIN